MMQQKYTMWQYIKRSKMDSNTALKMPLAPEKSIWLVKQEYFCETIHSVRGDWELLSGEYLVTLLKIT